MQKDQSELIQQKKMERIARVLYQEKLLTVVNQSAGKGGFGEVFIVQDENGHEFAIKILSIFDGFDSICDEKLKAAKQEANIMSECNHPNIVQCVDEFQIGTNYFIQMEKCEQSLQDFIDNKKNNPYNDEQFIEFALQILDAIQYLHEKNYVLRDISLKNILLDKFKQIKLCDLGLAKKIDSQLATQAFLTSNVKGVFFYFPPELLDLQNQGKKSVYQTIEGDIWAFGICMYILAGASFIHVLQFTEGKEQYIFQNSINKQTNELLIKILNKDPKSRPSIKKIIEQLREIISKDEIELKLLQKLILVNAENEQYLQSIGIGYYKQNNYKASVYYLNKCLKVNPDNKQGQLYKEKVIQNQEEKENEKQKQIELKVKKLLAEYEDQQIQDAIEDIQQYL